MATGLSPSSARIRGDDYQHLFTWVQVAKAIQEGSDVTSIGIEDPDAENADDFTIYKRDGKREYYQVKSSVDGRNTMGQEWLTKSSGSGGSSALQRFYKLWANEPDGNKPTITLVTNRLPAPADPLLSRRDGRDCTVARALESADMKSGLGGICKKLAEHLGVTKMETVEFFRNLRFVLGAADEYWMEMAASHMLAGGLLHDKGSIMQGVEIVRSWVTAGKRRIDADELLRAVEPLKRPDGLPSATILVQEIDRDPAPDNAVVVLDWVDSFPGSEPRVRRRPSESTLWNEQFRPQLKQAVRCLRGHTRVLVRGHMRLPTWFALGVELGKTAGFQVASLQHDAAWSSEGSPSDVPIEHAVKTLGSGRDLAVGISLASDLSQDALEYLDGRRNDVGKYAHVFPLDGANNTAVGSAAEARGWAYGIRNLVRSLVREHRPDNMHLFLATPHGVALLLGHLWDRMPPTQTYVDLGTFGGYAPSYLIPG